MSITSAMFAGVSGMSANSTALAAISDNIANMNTVGYKRRAAQFTNLVAPITTPGTYGAAGASAAMRQLVSVQGVVQSTGSTTDLAISGNGFFVVSDNSAGTGDTLFTRAGSFAPDSSGYLKNAGGYYIKGWPFVNGVVSADPSNMNSLETININDISGAAEATSRISFNANLNSASVVSAAEATYLASASANNMASGAVSPDFTRTVQVYDNLGASRSLTYSFLKAATPNQWHVEIYASPAADVTTGAGLVDGQVATGIVAFTGGELDTANTTLPTSLTFGASNAGAPGAGAVNWASGLGLEGQTINLSLGGADVAGGITQFASSSTLNSTTINGSALGNLTGVSFSKDGVMTAVFDNGLKRDIYKLPVATFVNPDGLYSVRGTAFRATADAGPFTLKEAGIGGAGVMQASALENANVDLAAEFTGLITTQRAYSASSKIITTADEMLDELIRIKR
jgi:flagellar hook protein FlgE